MRKSILALMAFFIMSASAWAGTNSAARKALEAKNYQQVIDLVANKELKTAEDNYLAGQAYYQTGKQKTAHGYWVKAIQQDKDAGGKHSYLFKPGLTGAQKGVIYKEFTTTFKELNAAVIGGLKDEAKSASRTADRTRIDAKRADAVDKNLTRKADAKTETINSQQKQKALNNQKSPKKAPIKKKGKGIGGMAAIVILVIVILLFVVFAVFGKKSDGPDNSEVAFNRASFGNRRYDVQRNDSYFDSGPFWYKGSYFHNESDFYGRHGYHYTNSMYMDNYDTYGHGQGRDEALDREIMKNIDEREDLREEAADAGLEADNLRADAEELDLDASEATEDIEELRETAALLDDEPEFEDDPEVAEEEPAFEDDVEEEVAEIEEEPSFEDDEAEEEPAFEDDEA